MKLIYQLKNHFVLLGLYLALGTSASFATTTYISSPYNGVAGVRPNSLTLTAVPVPGVPSYKIDISTSSNFASIFQTHTGSNSLVFTDMAYGTKYYVRVSTDGGATYGMTTSFITAIPAVTSPYNGATGTAPSSLTITSAKVPGATTYTMDVSTSSTFATITQTQTSGSNSQVFKDLAYGTKYYVRVKTDLLKSDGVTSYGYGYTTSFTTAIPEVTSPYNGAVGMAPASLTIISFKVPGATTYTIDLSTSSTFATIAQTQTSGSNSQVFTDLAYGTKYYVRVKTDLLKSDGVTSYGYGITTSFTTAIPVVTSPFNGASGISPASVTINSAKVPGATTYTIDISTSVNFTTVTSSTGTNSQLFSGLTASTKYYARVKTDLLKSDGTTSYGYGPITSFTTGAMPLAALPNSFNNPLQFAAQSRVGEGNGSTSFSTFNVNLFSNPTREAFKLRIDSDTDQSFAVRIYDFATGEQVHTSTQQTNQVIDLGRDLRSGKYVFHVTTPTGVETYLAIKE